MASSSSDGPPIPVFAGNKYEHWSVKMKIFLQCQGLWEFVESGYKVPDEEEALNENMRKDATALSYIQQGLSDDQFDKIIEATTAKEAWDILKNQNNNVAQTRTPVDNDANASQIVVAHPPPGVVPMQQMSTGYHNYPVAVPFQNGHSYPPHAGYPHYPSQPAFLYPSNSMQAPPGYPAYSPVYQHGGGYGYPVPPMQFAGGSLVAKLGKVANKVEQMSGVKITGNSTGQQMGHPMPHQMSGTPHSLPPPALPSTTSSGGTMPPSLPRLEGDMSLAVVIPHTSSGETSGHKGAIIGQQFVSSHTINLRVTRKMFAPGEGNFDITDSDGKLLFSVKGKLFSMHDKRTMYDAYGNPLVTFCSKSMSMHDKWYAYRGDSTKSAKLFDAKRSSLSMMQLKASLDVTLTCNGENNAKGKKCDFKVKGGWSDKSFTVHSTDTNSIVAEMSVELNLQSIILDRDTYVVTVYPKIDYAFISSLLVIFDGIVEDDKGGTSKYKMFLRR
ncbi:hypothetical protein LIER_23547 [Lithospermum erythrorhizon]|uniref:DUF4219 domain-containing protein n=1 Tax=Lithospermum erythrorhizon TaxID=34254 RepID=A0AAV3R240_LITER